MGQFLRAFSLLALTVTAALSLGCAGPEAPGSAVASEAAGVEEGPTRTMPRDSAAGLGVSEVDGFAVFPAFMPPIGFATETQECELGSDPYSTCI